MAVADISNCLFLLIPVIVTLYANGKWILGDTFCDVMYTYKYTFLVANIFLINFFSDNKLMRCVFPLRNLVVTHKQRFAVTAATVIMAAVNPVFAYYAAFIDNFQEVEYSFSQGMCGATDSGG